MAAEIRPALVCLSHLRWDFVFQRPQHLMVRAAREFDVFYVEEALEVADLAAPMLEIRAEQAGTITVVVFLLPPGLSAIERAVHERALFRELLSRLEEREILLWYYTPGALRFSRAFEASGIIYDCMDELTLFKGADPALKQLECELFERADVVFTGGPSLYRAKRLFHPEVHCFPSSIDFAHFVQARDALPNPDDQACIPEPRAGFYGVLDERFDIDLLRELSELRPEWSFVMLGPTAKIDPRQLPRAANIHYLGMKRYEELPFYLANWSAALLLFARNDATKFISPTKTPEYLAGGKPVLSTPITDVISPYGERGLVRICADAGEFAAALDETHRDARRVEWLVEVDRELRGLSWEKTWEAMLAEIRKTSGVHPFEERRPEAFLSDEERVLDS